MDRRKYSGVDVFVSKSGLNEAPHCPHGPTLLFERCNGNSTIPRQYYACSASRNHKECNFFQWSDVHISASRQKSRDERNREKSRLPLSHQKYFKLLKAFRRLSRIERQFCATCNVLVNNKDMAVHENHQMIRHLSKQQLRTPTSFLQPLSDNHSNAQYLFSSSSSKFFVNLIKKLDIHKVLCVGTPRVFEELNIHNSASDSCTMIECFLLDNDHRLVNFFHPQQFSRYNMFNHYFFDGKKARQSYLRFLSRQVPQHSTSSQHNILVILDPPFGGLVDILAFTLQSITEDYYLANSAADKCQRSLLPTLLIFPYFMEPRIKDALPSFSLIDYKIEYENHSSFRSRSAGGIKNGSPVRIFTNIDANIVTLPASQEYWYCSRCRRYSAKENIHCDDCNACTTKAGPTYVHCYKCGRCVKPTWKHCDECNACELPGRHSRLANRTGCHICGEFGHKRLQCPSRMNNHSSIQLKRKRASSRPLTNKSKKAK